MEEVTLDDYNRILKSRSAEINRRNFISSRFYRCVKNIFFDLENNKSVELYPNLIILGAQKSGTTSLHFYLEQHPDIFMSKPIKEPGFYRESDQNISYWEKKNIIIKNKYSLLADFMLQDYTGQKYIGDSSTFYTNKKLNNNLIISKNIKTYTDKPKLIYIVRNPYHRLISNFLHSAQRGYIKDSFEEWILEKGKENVYTSMYFFQLNQYLTIFGRECIHIVIYDNLINYAEKELRKLESFLGLNNYTQYKIDQYNKTTVNLSNKNKESLWNSDTLNEIKDLIYKDLKKFENEFDIDLPKHFFKSSY